MSFTSSSSRSGPGSPAGARDHSEIVVCACLDSGIPLPVKLIELARTDLMILSDRPLRFGTPLRLAIFSDLVCAVTQNRAIVHWCRPHPRGWLIGCFLVNPLPDRLTECAWNDLRDCLRYECNWKAWVLWDDDGELATVRILDYSVKGLRFRADIPASVGSTFTLFGSAGRHDRAVLTGKVQWSRGVDGSCQIGCVIQGQSGRDLPRIFGNLAAVHVDGEDSAECLSFGSAENRRWEQSGDEQFLTSCVDNDVQFAVDQRPDTSRTSANSAGTNVICGVPPVL